MELAYWIKQDFNEPLFKNLIWSKPEQKSLAGKLLIIGGNLHGISAPAEAFNIATVQGVGECKVIMPGATKKLLPNAPKEIIFTASTPSGSFSGEALGELKSFAEWADGVLFAGDIGNNSETTLLVEQLLKLGGLQFYGGDSTEAISGFGLNILQRPSTAMLIGFGELQKIVCSIHYPKALSSTMSLIQIVEFLHDFSSIFQCNIMLKFQTYLVIASSGQVITMAIPNWPENWNIKYATASIVWWIQNPQKPLQALATAITQV